MVESILAMAASPWALVVLVLVCTIDGFFPPIPSESAVIALASLAMAGKGPSFLLLIPAAALGAFCGDTIAYLIGTRVPVRRLRLFRTRRGQRRLDWAERTLRHRGGAFILSARFIPIGRVAVNMTAGAVGFGFKRFIGYAGIAAVMWAIYSTILGISAGAVLRDHPVIAVSVGVVIGLVMGTLVDAVMRRILGLPPGVASEGQQAGVASEGQQAGVASEGQQAGVASEGHQAVEQTAFPQHPDAATLTRTPVTQPP